nr:MAG TPA: hypothetical protein [Caudoviricetes sp.]
MTFWTRSRRQTSNKKGVGIFPLLFIRPSSGAE